MESLGVAGRLKAPKSVEEDAEVHIDPETDQKRKRPRGVVRRSASLVEGLNDLVNGVSPKPMEHEQRDDEKPAKTNGGNAPV